MSLEVVLRNDFPVFKLSSPSGGVIFVRPKETNSLEVTNPQGKKDGFCVALNGKSVRVGTRGESSSFLNELRHVVTNR